MTDRDRPLDPAVLALRAEFDAAFQAPPRAEDPDGVAVLAARLGPDLLAVRVLELAGIVPARPIVPVPSRRPELLGLCGIRGAVVPVYALARLLRRADPQEPARWLLLAGAGDARIALAVTALEGRLRVPAAALRRAAEEAKDHVPEVVAHDGRLVPVVSVPSLLRSITEAEG